MRHGKKPCSASIFVTTVNPLLVAITTQFKRQITLPREDYREPRPLVLVDNTLITTDMLIKGVYTGYYSMGENHSWLNGYDTTTGELQWRTPTLEHSHIYRFIVQGDRIFLASSSLRPEVKSVIQAFSIQ